MRRVLRPSQQLPALDVEHQSQLIELLVVWNVFGVFAAANQFADFSRDESLVEVGIDQTRFEPRKYQSMLTGMSMW